MTQICVSKLTIIGSDNGLSCGRRQAIIWTNAAVLLIRTLGTNFGEIVTEIHTFSLKKMRLKMSSAKRQPFCLGLNMLTVGIWQFYHECMFSSVQFSSVQLIFGRRLRGMPLCPDLRRFMRLIGHMGLSYDRIGRGGLSSACPIVAWMRWRLLP